MKRRLEFEKRLNMIIKQGKEQKQDIIKHKTKIYTEAFYSTLKSRWEEYQQRKEIR